MMTCGDGGPSTGDEVTAETGSDRSDAGGETRRTVVIQSGSRFAEREVHVCVIDMVREWTRLPKEKNGIDKPSEARC